MQAKNLTFRSLESLSAPMVVMLVDGDGICKMSC